MTQRILQQEKYKNILKEAMNKTSKQDFNMKLGIQSFSKDHISKFTHHCKNIKLRQQINIKGLLYNGKNIKI